MERQTKEPTAGIPIEFCQETDNDLYLYPPRSCGNAEESVGDISTAYDEDEDHELQLDAFDQVEVCPDIGYEDYTAELNAQKLKQKEYSSKSYVRKVVRSATFFQNAEPEIMEWYEHCTNLRLQVPSTLMKVDHCMASNCQQKAYGQCITCDRSMFYCKECLISAHSGTKIMHQLRYLHPHMGLIPYKLDYVHTITQAEFCECEPDRLIDVTMVSLHGKACVSHYSKERCHPEILL